MQDIGAKEDTELSKEDLTLSLRELSVESHGHCPVYWKWMFFPRGYLAGQTKGQSHLI
jgi:hypothetical protein